MFTLHCLEFVTSTWLIANGLEITGEESNLGLGFGLDMWFECVLPQLSELKFGPSCKGLRG
jgi:hypothetical protein